ncbi:DUF748 domain-containing protein [Oxalicibacterium solurbis]|uniref:DUF748 domain-containing protein n=1 Tax=Oxalicibacterium solurbis TaxID=69280 RepID=A0A8J3AZJ0_9BURK|nr:DUF748 domain-containing protein [Oxalicibacterium solurbis]GGI53877.1 hypothetical protein GCM10011430_10510 [Oxalicibacterium solurbis]
MPNFLSRLPQTLRTFSRKPAARRSFIGLLAFILLIGLFGYFVLPGIIKSQAEQLISEKLNRQTTIGKVDVSPYAMRVTIHDMKMMEPEGDAVFASFGALTVNVSLQSLFRFAPVIEEFKLDAPYVHLVRKDAQHYNIDDLIALANSQPPKQEDSKPARFSVFNIQINGGRFELDDKLEQVVHKITDLKLGIPFISSLPSQVDVFVEPMLSANINGTPLLVKGKAHPFADPMEATVDLNLDNLDLTTYLKYIPGTPHFKLPSARLDMNMVAHFQQKKDAAPALLLTGDVTLKNVQLNDASDKSILKLPSLKVTLQDAKVLDSKIAVARVAIDGIETSIARAAGGRLNIDNLLTPPTATAPKAVQKSQPKQAKASTPAEQAAPSTAAATATEADKQTTKQAPPAKSAEPLVLALGELEIRNAAFSYADAQAAQPMQAGAKNFDLNVRNVNVDTGKRIVDIGEVVSNRAGFSLQQGNPPAARKRNGNAATTSTPSKPAAKKNGKKDETEESGYIVNIGKIAIADWSAQLEDRSLRRPAVTTIAPLNLAMQNVSTKPDARGRIDLQATVNKNGKLSVQGELGMAPLYGDLALDFRQVDIMQLQPYFTDQVNILLTRANVSGKGALRFAQTKGNFTGSFKGDVALDDLATVDKLSASDFLRWKSLSVKGMNVNFSPFSLDIDQVALNSFFARIIIDQTGRLNLQDIVRGEDGAQKSVTGQEHNPAATQERVRGTNVASAPLQQPAKPASAVPPIKIGKVLLRGGRVRFTDNFIRPHYTATLERLGGTVAGLSSDTNSNANVDLKGLVNSAPLAVAGRINPLKGDLSMDIRAEVRGMELAPLSTYSGRYIGYGIEKGKLTFDVSYKVEDRVLTAQNRLILEQLTLGDKVDSPDAPSLPVQFALSLLKDRNGVIDINLPIGGSLDDPQFSIGGIIVKVIVNLITKAVTAPFTLIGSMFGGGEELSHLAFDPGRAALTDKASEKLKTIAKALDDRPALKLEITGRTDPQADREGLKRASIDRKVRALKLKDMVARGQSAEGARVTVTPQEYPVLLKRVYKDEDFKKPRNMIGMQKDLPVEEMEKLMTENAKVGDDDLIVLGNRRAQAAKDWLTTEGKIPAERIFILASKSGADAKDGASASRVDFSLK